MIAHAPRYLVLVILGLLVLGGAALADRPLPRLTPEAVAAAMDSPTPPLIFDARRREAYASGSLPGAVGVGRDPAGFLPDAKGGTAVIVLPSGSPARLEAAWVKRLQDFGYAVGILAGGIEAWRAAKLPVEEPGHAHIRPGSVPFTIPRGLCETNPPAQVFE